MPRALQIEELVLVERADVAPWPQTTSSAKISSSGLLYMLAPSAEEDGLAQHLAVGLLRAGRDDDLALEDAGRLVVEDVL